MQAATLAAAATTTTTTTGRETVAATATTSVSPPRLASGRLSGISRLGGGGNQQRLNMSACPNILLPRSTMFRTLQFFVLLLFFLLVLCLASSLSFFLFSSVNITSCSFSLFSMQHPGSGTYIQEYHTISVSPS